MKTFTIDREELVSLTEEYGGKWGINHVCRLLELIAIIGEDEVYDEEALWVATYLHDWGAYSHWSRPSVHHAVRSTEVAEAFLSERQYPEPLKSLVLECIANHHSLENDMSTEALLLRDADALDFLGVVGALRIFSKSFKELRQAYEKTKKKRDLLADVFFFDKARRLAEDRTAELDALLAAFERDSFGYF
jgi:uncharacterized protein